MTMGNHNPNHDRAVLRVADSEVVTVLETGPRSCEAAITPGDRQALVDTIEDGTIFEIAP